MRDLAAVGVAFHRHRRLEDTALDSVHRADPDAERFGKVFCAAAADDVGVVIQMFITPERVNALLDVRITVSHALPGQLAAAATNKSGCVIDAHVAEEVSVRTERQRVIYGKAVWSGRSLQYVGERT